MRYIHGRRNIVLPNSKVDALRKIVQEVGRRLGPKDTVRRRVKGMGRVTLIPGFELAA